jgi:hypothetical protein
MHAWLTQDQVMLVVSPVSPGYLRPGLLAQKLSEADPNTQGRSTSPHQQNGIRTQAGCGHQGRCNQGEHSPFLSDSYTA